MPGNWGSFYYEVTYLDGEIVKSRPSLRARLEIERKWPEGAAVGDGKLVMNPTRPVEEASFFAAWWGLDKPDGSLEAWLDRVLDIREVYPETDPSQPAASAGESAS